MNQTFGGWLLLSAALVACVPTVAGDTFAVGDRVWDDLDGDGIQDAGEPGVPGVPIALRLGSGALFATTVTDSDGRYGFEGVLEGLYFLNVTVPPLASLTSRDRGDDDGLDSDAYPLSGGTPTFRVDSVADATRWDFGLTASRIGGRVWLDDDGAGLQGPAEPGLPHVAVELLDEFGNTIQETATDANGGYEFPGLARFERYRVRFAPPVGWPFTLPDQGQDDSADSDASPQTGETALITLTEFVDAARWDAGVLGVSLGDRVWNDLDADGVQDAGEPGIGGLELELWDQAGFVQVAMTDPDGLYLFSSVHPFRAYSLQFPGVQAFLATLPGRADEANDSDLGADGTLQLPFPLGVADSANSDVGLIQAGTVVGGWIWKEEDRDGVRESSEEVLPGLTVTVLATDGAPIASATTDVLGRYRIPGLTPEASYRLRFERPANHFFTELDAFFGDETTDSDAEPATGETVLFVLSGASDADDWSAGVAGAAVGGRSFIDADGDGDSTGERRPYDGVEIDLLDAAGATIVSRTTSLPYIFGDLEVGATYALQYRLIPGLRFTLQDATGDDQTDSDVDPATGRTPFFILSSVEDAGRWDVGLLEFPEIIGDRVWLDLNQDGEQDFDEPGAADVTVELLDDGRQLLATTTTDDSGFYQFPGLTPDTLYVVRFVAPPDLGFTLQNADDDDDDSDADPETGEVSVLLDSRDLARDVDAGLIPPAIGDRAWHDLNADGRQDGDEPGVRGVTVVLQNESGAPIDATSTDISGHYAFTDVEFGTTYRLVFDPTVAYAFSPADATADDSDSDVDLSGATPFFVLTSARDTFDWDAGLIELPSSIGGRAWLDLDEGGTEGSGEPGLAGVVVELFDGDGTLLAQSPTDSIGRYSFDELVPLIPYRLRFTPQPGFLFTVVGAGSNDLIDSDADPATGDTVLFVLQSPFDAIRWDAGFVGEVWAIGGRAWDDLDADGVQDPAEPGVADAIVDLLDASGEFLARKESDGNGDYLFTGLDVGTTYRLRAVPRHNQRLTSPDQGDDDLLDSDFDPVELTTAPIVLTDVTDRVRWDLGLTIGRESIGDRTWLDNDGNGVQDDGEPGLGGVSVDLLGDDGVLQTVISGVDGAYRFDGRFAGDRLRLRFRAPVGHVLTAMDSGNDATDSDADPITGLTDWFVLNTDDDATRWDAGIVSLLGTVGDRVWKDANGNGLQDPREPGVEGVQVWLFLSSGQILSFRDTDAEGVYRFGDLFSAPHFVRFIAPTGFVFTTPDAGLVDDTDSDADPVTGETARFTPASEDDATRWDAGIVHDCPFPDRALELLEVGRTEQAVAIFTLFDPNDPARVTGYRARRSDDEHTPIATWPPVGPTFDGPIWEDEAVPPPGIAWFYQFSAITSECTGQTAEGPW